MIVEENKNMNQVGINNLDNTTGSESSEFCFRKLHKI